MVPSEPSLQPIVNVSTKRLAEEDNTSNPVCRSDCCMCCCAKQILGPD